MPYRVHYGLMRFAAIFIVSLFLIIPFANAIEINPSVESQPIYCRLSFTSWICDIGQGSQGPQGPEGMMNQTPNMSILFGSTWYPHNIFSSDIPGYKVFNRTYPYNTENSSAVVASTPGTEYLLDQFVSEPGDPGLYSLPAGQRDWYTHGKVSSLSGGNSYIRIRLYKRNTAGTETELYNLTTAALTTTTEEILTTKLTPYDIGMNASDRFVAKYYAVTNSASNPTITLYFDGVDHPTRATSPIGITGAPGPKGDTGEAINESYAYLPGRVGGQLLQGGIASTDSLTLNGSANNGYVILQPSGGRVGIGRNDPTQTLEVNGNIRANASNPRLFLFDSTASASADGEIQFYKNRNGASPACDDLLGAIVARGFDGTAYRNGAYFSFEVDGIPGLGSMPGRMTFRTTPNGSTTAIQRIRITKDGYVTIGTLTNGITAQLDTTGSVRFRNCSGTPTFDTGGNLTCASDPKLKTAVTTYTSDSAKVASVIPIKYKWSQASGYDTTHTNTGFDAAQIQAIYPECIIARDDVVYSQVCDKEENCETVEKKTGTQTLAIDDKCLIAVLFNAAKDQQTKITSLEARITALEKGTVKP